MPTPDERRALRAALVDVAPWLAHPEAGPATVDAGTCERCDLLPRVVPTCGPVAWRALCRDCTLVVGEEAWCDGHAALAAEVLAWVEELPAWWDSAVVCWWVATGEVAQAPARLHPGLPVAVRAALPRGAGPHD